MLSNTNLQNLAKICFENKIGFENEIIFPESLIILVEQYKEKFNFNCLVCQDGFFIFRGKRFDNVFSFTLSQIINRVRAGKLLNYRSSFIVEKAGHWVAVEIHIIRKLCYFVVLDAAGSHKANAVRTDITKAFRANSHSLARLFHCNVYTQKDALNCSLFALSNAIELSKLSGIVEYLLVNEFRFKLDLFNGKIRHLTSNYLHPNLSKGIQNFELLTAYVGGPLECDFAYYNDLFITHLNKHVEFQGMEGKYLNKYFDRKRHRYTSRICHTHSFESFKAFVKNHLVKYIGQITSVKPNESTLSYFVPNSYDDYMRWRVNTEHNL